MMVLSEELYTCKQNNRYSKWLHRKATRQHTFGF